MTRYLALLIIISLLSTILSGCAVPSEPTTSPPSEEPEPVERPEDGVYRYPISSLPSSFDPVKADNEANRAVVTQAYSRLVGLDELLRPIPDLAESWETSPDGRTYTFHLRDDAFFHDGNAIFAEGQSRPANARDVSESLHRFLSAKGDNLWLLTRIDGASEFLSGNSSSVRGIKVVDDSTISITLIRPYSPFLADLASPELSIVPAEATGEQLDQVPVGTGPFRFVEQGEDEFPFVELESNPSYFGGTPEIQGIRFLVINDPARMLAEYEAGRLEEAPVPDVEYSRILSDPELSTGARVVPRLGVEYIGLNTHDPILSDKMVRQALNLAVDREYIINDLLQDRYLEVAGILPPGIWSHNPDLKGYDYNPDTARELLKLAGYTDRDNDGVLEKNGKPLRLSYLIVAGSRIGRPIAEAVATDLSEVGVKVDIVEKTWETEYLEIVDSGQTQMFRLGWLSDIPDPDSLLYPLFHSRNAGPGGNSSFYSNPQVDQWLDQARSTADIAKREQLYQQIEETIIADAPWIFMFSYTQFRLVKPYVENRVVTPYGPERDPLWNVGFKEH